MQPLFFWPTDIFFFFFLLYLRYERTMLLIYCHILMHFLADIAIVVYCWYLKYIIVQAKIIQIILVDLSFLIHPCINPLMLCLRLCCLIFLWLVKYDLWIQSWITTLQRKLMTLINNFKESTPPASSVTHVMKH